LGASAGKRGLSGKKYKIRQFRKKAKLRRANLSGVRLTPVRRSDFEMQRNGEIGFFRNCKREPAAAKGVKR
jgi:hypothetical protein